MLNNNFFFIIASLICLFACYSAEYSTRKNFYLIHLLEMEKHFKTQMNNAMKEKINELEESASKIKVLKGLIPICSNCKSIRDDKGYWKQVEVYVKENSNAKFSHGICPDCMTKLYPELFCTTCTEKA